VGGASARVFPVVLCIYGECRWAGVDGAPRFVTCTKDALNAVTDSGAKAALEQLPLAGAPNSLRRNRVDRTRISQPPGGVTHVKFVTPAVDENPAVVEGDGFAPLLSEPARSKLEQGIPAGVKYLEGAADQEETVKFGRKPLQGVGGNSVVQLGDPSLPVPKLSIMQEDLLLTQHPALQAAASQLPEHGARVDNERWARKARIDGYWTQDKVQIKDNGQREPMTTVWELDVQKALTTAGDVKENTDYTQHAGVRLCATYEQERQRDGLRKYPQAYATSVVINYATERNDDEARLSPPRAKNLPLHGDPRTFSCRRRPVSAPMKANAQVGTSLIGGIAEPNPYLSTYQAACAGYATHVVETKRTLVRRLQNAGGHSTVSLTFDPDAAGVRTVFDMGVGENPITAGAPPYNPFAPPAAPDMFGTIPQPSQFGKRVAYARPFTAPYIPEGQEENVVNPNIPRISRVAPPGGVTSFDLASM
jgi:hypothetical protein